MGRKSKAEERKKEILDHYFQVIITEGFENASVAKIASRMEVPPSLIMHYFKTKDEMIIGVMDYSLRTYIDEELSKLINQKIPEKKLNILLDGFTLFNEKSAHFRVILDLIKYLSYFSPIIDERNRAMSNEYHSILINQFAIMYEAGIIQNPNSDILSDLYIMLHCGLAETYKYHNTDDKRFQLLQNYAINLFKIKLKIKEEICIK